MQYKQFTQRPALFLFALAALIAAGLVWPFPVIFFDGSIRADTPILVCLVLAWLAPFVPLTMVTVRVLLRRPLPPTPVTATALVTLLIGFAVAPLGMLGGPIAWTQGMVLLQVAPASILVLAYGRLGLARVQLLYIGMAVGTVAAAFLTIVPMMIKPLNAVPSPLNLP